MTQPNKSFGRVFCSFCKSKFLINRTKMGPIIMKCYNETSIDVGLKLYGCGCKNGFILTISSSSDSPQLYKINPSCVFLVNYSSDNQLIYIHRICLAFHL
jgi:hypothetical protein